MCSSIRRPQRCAIGLSTWSPARSTLSVDGDSIEIVYPDGKREEWVCTYIDEYHTQVGARVFHICEFAEIMEANGKSYCPARNREKEVEERKEAAHQKEKTGNIRMERSRR